MGNFSVNQNRLFFVITKASAESTKEAVKNASAGAFIVNTGKNKNEKSIMVLGVSGPTTILLNTDCVDSIAITEADKMKYNLRSYKLELNPIINDGDIVAAEDYVIRINFINGTGFSPENNYIKDAAVRTYVGMDKATFFTNLAFSLFINLNRLYVPAVSIGIKDKIIASAHKNANGDIILKDKDGLEITSSGVVEGAEYITINELASNDWSADRKPFYPTQFLVIPTTIRVDGEEMVWGKVTDNTETYGQSVKNGFKTAELEWFCMGERADQYRNVGYPKTIATKYMVDPSKEYDYLDILYHFSGNMVEDSGKTPKHLTVVADSSVKDGLTAIKTALGL